jgi:hypothetical protein
VGHALLVTEVSNGLAEQLVFLREDPSAHELDPSLRGG